MNPTPSIRKKIFWTLDFFRPDSVRNHYLEIAAVIEAPSSAKSLKIKNRLLNDLLNHAIETIPFYAELNFKSIIDFPVVNKKIIQSSFEDFKSTKFLKKKLYRVSTSGSTGVPFFLFQNNKKRRRNTADVLYFSNAANFKFGEKLYYLEAWRNSNMSSSLNSWIKNLVYVDISHFDGERISAFLQELEGNSQSKNIIGLPSSFESICRYLDKTKSKPLNHLKVKSIIAVSEYLNNYVESSMKKYFGVKVVSRYSNEEMGIIAQQPLEGEMDKFKINTASYYVEILEMDGDKPVNKNEMGRIVITDLFNYSMPLIRYDTGDIATLGNDLLLGKIEGRKMDFLYATNGELISPHLIHVILYKYFNFLKQYQFIQEEKNKYTIKLNVNNSFNQEQQLILDVKKEFGNDAIINIEYVDEIPPLSSGKRKKVINNFKGM